MPCDQRRTSADQPRARPPHQARQQVLHNRYKDNWAAADDDSNDDGEPKINALVPQPCRHFDLLLQNLLLTVVSLSEVAKDSLPVKSSRVDLPPPAEGDQKPKGRKRGPQLADDQAFEVGELADGQQQEHGTVYDGANEARGQHSERKAPLQWRINPHVCQFRQQEGGN